MRPLERLGVFCEPTPPDPGARARRERGAEGAGAMMRPTAIKGDGAVAYYDSLAAEPRQLASGRGVEDYYQSTDELPGVWWGPRPASWGWRASPRGRRSMRCWTAFIRIAVSGSGSGCGPMACVVLI